MSAPAWYVLSFAHPERPKGEQFLGWIVVRATNPEDAIRESRAYGINPGGEALISPLEASWAPDSYTYRLMSRDEFDAFWRIVTPSPDSRRASRFVDDDLDDVCVECGVVRYRHNSKPGPIHEFKESQAPS